jgi:hypothetical protein
MTSRKVFAVMAALALLAISTVTSAGIVDPTHSWATLATAGTIVVAPGGGHTFVYPDNHQIDVFLNDDAGNPVEIINSDIWLEDVGVVWCPGGVFADSSTFAPDPGHTTFTGMPQGGVDATGGFDCANIALDVIAMGFQIAIDDHLELSVASPDLEGSGSVTAADFAVFATLYNTDSHCANFDESTSSPTCSAADFALFATFYNLSVCP